MMRQTLSWFRPPPVSKSLTTDRFRRVIGLRRDFPLTHFWLAAALAHLDRWEEARTEVQFGLALDATFTIRRFLDRVESDNPVFLRQRQRHADGMRKAGVPEG